MNKKLVSPAATLHPISVDSPWHRIGIDLVGPLPRTDAGNAYIITASDYFTKWPEASAIPDKTASTVASFLFKLITRHGSPVIIQSDQDREFVNQVNKHLFELPHGVSEGETQEVKEEDLDSHMVAMMEWAEEVKAKSNIETAQSKQKKDFDAKHKPPTFKVGDKVWVYNSRNDTRQGGKLEWNWNGPYEVTEHTTRGTYRLKNQHGKLLKQAISSNRLKPYNEPPPKQEQVDEKRGEKTQQKGRKRVIDIVSLG